MELNESFEYTRDRFFINPKQPSSGDLVEAVHALIDGIVTKNAKPDHAEDNTKPLTAIANELVKDYQQARYFDHLSVTQLLPSDNKLGILAHLASDLRNNNTIIGETSPLETEYEHQAMQWLITHIAGYNPDKASGSLVSGGTSANHTALLVAREKLQEKGWQGIAPVKLFASEMAHYSISKAARMLAPRGLIQVEKIPLTEGSYSMDPAALERRVRQAKGDKQLIMGIVAVAGETETGLVDDLVIIAQIADENDIYLHVDGAYGAPFVLSKVKDLFAGMEASTSLTCDPHKYLYLPYSAGSIMFKDGTDHALLVELNEGGEKYMFKSDLAKSEARRDFVHSNTYLGQKRVEGSVGGQAAAALHATIKHIGREGIAALLDHNIEMAQSFADEVRAYNSLRLSFEPQLNTVCVEPAESHPKNNERLEAVSAALEKPTNDQGKIYLATTSLPERREPADKSKPKSFKVLRFVATHPYTDADDVRYIAKRLKEEWEKTGE